MARLPTAAPRIDRLAAVLGLDLAELHVLLAEAAAAGLIQLWDARPRHAGVCLSPLAAERLGLRLDAAGVHYSATGPRRCFCGRWTDRGEPAARVKRQGLPADADAEDAIDSLERIPDHRAIRPELALMAAEALEALPGPPTEDRPRTGRGDWGGAANWRSFRPLDLDRMPPPVILLGLGIPWNSAEDPAGGCPVGHGPRLPRIAYCVRCDRSGIDHLLPDVGQARRRAKRARMSKGQGLKGGVSGR